MSSDFATQGRKNTAADTIVLKSTRWKSSDQKRAFVKVNILDWHIAYFTVKQEKAVSTITFLFAPCHKRRLQRYRCLLECQHISAVSSLIAYPREENLTRFAKSDLW